MSENKKKKYSEQEINKYQNKGFFSRIPYCVKALFLKWWAFGAGIFFIFIGLSNVLAGDKAPSGGLVWVLGALLALFNGVVTDVVVDKILELFETPEKRESQWYKMFHNKKLYSLFINIAYSFLLTYVVIIFVDVIAYLLKEYTGSAGVFKNGIEPYLTGLIFLVFDMIFISIKNGIVILIRKNKNKNKEEVK